MSKPINRTDMVNFPGEERVEPMTPPVPVSPHPEEGLRKVLRKRTGCEKRFQHSMAHHTAVAHADTCDACADLVITAIAQHTIKATVAALPRGQTINAESVPIRPAPDWVQWVSAASLEHALLSVWSPKDETPKESPE